MITYEDVIMPVGPVHADLLPDRRLIDDVEHWIAQAYAKPKVAALPESARDAAALAWACYRAFDMAVVSMAANPNASSQTDAGSASYTKDQRDTLRAKAAHYLNEYTAALSADAPVPRYVGSRTVENRFVW